MKKLVFNSETRESVEVDLSAEEIAAAQAAAASEAAAVPKVLTPAQFWMQLAIDGDEAEALLRIQELPRPQQILATKASEYRRSNALLLSLATALGKSSQQLDEFFIAAAALS